MDVSQSALAWRGRFEKSACFGRHGDRGVLGCKGSELALKVSSHYPGTVISGFVHGRRAELNVSPFSDSAEFALRTETLESDEQALTGTSDRRHGRTSRPQCGSSVRRRRCRGFGDLKNEAGEAESDE